MRIERPGPGRSAVLPAAVLPGTVLPAAVLGLVATLLAAGGSWIPSLWGDEATTSMSARRSWASLWTMAHHVDAVHSTYYAAMHLWVDAFGVSAFALRLPSAIAVGIATAGVFVLVRSIRGSTAAAVTAALVCAVLPRTTYAGEEARSFAATAAVATWIVVLLVWTLRGTVSRRVGWTVVAALLVVGTYLFLYTALMVLVVVAALLLTGSLRSHLRPAIVAVVAWLVLCSPIVVAGWAERGQISYLDDSVTSDPYSLLVGLWFSSVGAAIVGWVCIVVALVAVAVGLVRTRPWRGGGAGGPREDTSSWYTVVVVWAFAPTLLLVAAQVAFHGFSGRYMTFCAPAAAVLVARGVDVVAALGRGALGRGELSRGEPGRGELSRREVSRAEPGRGPFSRGLEGRVVAAVALVALAATFVPVYFAQRTPYAKNGSDWAQVAAVVRAHATSGDDVLFDETAKLSHRPRLGYRSYPSAYQGLHDVALTTPYWRNTTWHDEALTIDEAVAAGRVRSDTVWVVQYLDDASGGTEGAAALRAAGYRQQRTWTLNTDRVVEYRRG